MATNDNINSNNTSYTTTNDTIVCPSRLTIFRKRLCEKIIEWHEHEHEHEHDGSVNNKNIPPTSTISPNTSIPITIEEALDPIIHNALVMTGLSDDAADNDDDYYCSDDDETIEEDDVTPLMVACCDKDHDANLSCLFYFVTLYSKKESYKNQDGYIQILNELLGDCLCCNRIDGNNQAIHYAASSCLPPQMALKYLAQIYIHQRCHHHDVGDDDGHGHGHGDHISMQQACFVLLSQVNNHGDTPFMMAAANGKRLSIEYWIYPLMLQQNGGGGGGGGVKKQDIMNLLMANNHSNDTVLSLAYGHGHYDIVKFLILEKSHENENYHYCHDNDYDDDEDNNNNNNNNRLEGPLIQVQYHDVQRCKALLEKMNSIERHLLSSSFPSSSPSSSSQNNTDKKDMRDEFLHQKTNIQKCYDLLCHVLAKYADQVVSSLLLMDGDDNMLAMPKNGSVSSKQNKKKKSRKSNASKRLDKNRGNGNDNDGLMDNITGGSNDESMPQNLDGVEPMTGPKFVTLQDGTVVSSSHPSSLKPVVDSSMPSSFTSATKPINHLLRDRCSDTWSRESEELLEALCLDASMLLLSSQSMALNLSPSQLETVETVLKLQLKAVETAKNIHDRLMTK